jgi:hypothetical protein
MFSRLSNCALQFPEERVMHIHSNLNNIQAASLAGASSYRAENAERAAQTRRRLMKAAQTPEGSFLEGSDPSASFLVGEWLTVRHNHALAEDEYTPGSVDGAGRL